MRQGRESPGLSDGRKRNGTNWLEISLIMPFILFYCLQRALLTIPDVFGNGNAALILSMFAVRQQITAAPGTPIAHVQFTLALCIGRIPNCSVVQLSVVVIIIVILLNISGEISDGIQPSD